MMTSKPLSQILPDPTMITLAKGAHANRSDGVCLMEAVSWWVGEEHSDRPMCVDPKLAFLGRSLNDTMLDHYREGFAALIPELAGTANDGKAETREKIANRVIIDVVINLFASMGHEIEPVENETVDQFFLRIAELVIQNWMAVLPLSSNTDRIALAFPISKWMGVPRLCHSYLINRIYNGAPLVKMKALFLIERKASEDALLDAQAALAKGYAELVRAEEPTQQEEFPEQEIVAQVPSQGREEPFSFDEEEELVTEKVAALV